MSSDDTADERPEESPDDAVTGSAGDAGDAGRVDGDENDVDGNEPDGDPVPVERVSDQPGDPAASGGQGSREGMPVDGDEVRDRLEDEAERARSEFDERLVDLLSWLLDTETRARIYVHLRQSPGSTSEEIAEGTGLYPSTVREALAELHEEGTVTRGKRESEGAGNNPYEYRAIPPSDLVGDVVEEVQDELNTVFNLDRYLGGRTDRPASEPVTITVTDGPAADSEGDSAAASTAAEESGADTDEEPAGDA